MLTNFMFFFSEKDSATLCSSSNIANPSMLLIKEQCSVKAPTLNYKKKQALMKKAAECVHMLINLCQQASQERAYSTLLQQVFLNKT